MTYQMMQKLFLDFGVKAIVESYIGDTATITHPMGRFSVRWCSGEWKTICI